MVDHHLESSDSSSGPIPFHIPTSYSPELHQQAFPIIPENVVDLVFAVLAHLQTEPLHDALLGECPFGGRSVLDLVEHFVGGVEVDGGRGFGLTAESKVEVAGL